MIDARYTEAHRGNDGAGKGWDLFPEPDTRPLPIAKIIMAVAVVGLVFGTIIVGALTQ